MQKIYFPDLEKNRVRGILSIPSQAHTVIIFSHGLTSNKDSRVYRELQEESNLKGIGTLRYDYYAHGESDGKFEEITLTKALSSLQAAIQYVQTQGDYQIAVVGSSFGGLLSMLAAARDPSIYALVLKDSVIEPVVFWKDRLNPQRIEQWKKEGVLHYDDHGERYNLNYTFWQDLQSYNTLEEAKKIRCPSLIVHGDKDTVVPITQSQTLAQILHTQIHIITGANHSYAKPEQYAEVKKAIIDFICQHFLN